ncbi:hypothetical protein NCAS_0C02080 [Naumovozyma castellii]|uniref:Uncharacterized protein n=1 Tax=Naumovozyma castellii TaxID=27288 RepID=G0VCI8_NAUCA|nr:hypothetical protein NCAS_0C02080 [Naumovozyma castellii CBS 4309]CCC69198.1 hypothetical protein NCAS_0C02080 [Naumovozyma castellii CBS 4309]
MTLRNRKKSTWRRLLWQRQDYPDNYTDPNFIKFLEKLEKKKKEPRPIATSEDYLEIRSHFLDFYYVVLNTFFIFICFSYIYYYNRDPLPLTTFLTIAIIFLIKCKKTQVSTQLNLKSSIIITFMMLTLSPVLKSLSKTTASDSIWTLSFWLTILYIFVVSSSTQKDKPSNLSTNVLFANVSVLASRLSTTTEVFCFLSICIELNIILPKLIERSNIFVVITSNFIVYTFLNLTFGWYHMLLFFLLSMVYITVLPRLFLYWRINYHRADVEVLDIWDPKIPILE